MTVELVEDSSLRLLLNLLLPGHFFLLLNFLVNLIDDINDVNVDELSVISRYVTNPLLINGHKFDLRIYVLITCYEPLRIYIFQEGLARFASETYTSKINKNNKYMHLTNYSINKKNEKFIKNENCE